MGSTTIGKLALKIQDDNETNSILPTAQNFERISEAYDDLINRGLGKEFDTLPSSFSESQLNALRESGVYYTTSRYFAGFLGFSDNSDLKRIEVAQASMPGKKCTQKITNVDTGASIERFGKNDSWDRWKICNGFTEGRSTTNPNGEYHYYPTNQFALGKKLYTALISFAFVQNKSITLKGITGHVVRYEGILKGNFESMGALGGVTTQKTLPYICTPFDNVHSAWLSFASSGEDNNVRMVMHGANSNAENSEGLIQIWFYKPEEESV